MISIRYTFPLALLCLLAISQNSHAQCTTDAGTISGGALSCEGEAFSINNLGNEILDCNDILVFVAYTGAAPNASTVFATSSSVNFAYQGNFLTNSPFKVAAVAGNDAGGTVDWNDPCLSVSNDVTITYLPPPTVTVSGDTLDCINTFVIISASVNQQNCSFQWSNGATGQALTVQVPGQYCLTVTNAAGCTVTECVTVEQDIVAPVANAGPDQTLTCATIQVTLIGGNSSIGPNFTYLWSGPGIFPANANLVNPIITQAGTYTLVVTNTQNGCTATDQVFVVADFTPPFVTAGPDTGIPCGGGTATLNASGQPVGGITFGWSAPNGFNSNLQNPIVSQSGTYTVIVTNAANGCTATDQVTVFPGPAIPLQDFQVTNATCQGINDGSISLTMSLGQPPFLFQWTGPGGFSAGTEDISNLAPGTYRIAATDATTCTYYADVVVGQVSAMTIPAPQILISNLTCFGSSNGAISFPIVGGTPPFMIVYQWNGTPGVTFFSQTNNIFLNNLPAGIYAFTITDASGCSLAPPLFSITQPAQLVVTANPIDCGDNSVQLMVAGGALPYQFSWNPGVASMNLNTLTVEFAQSGTYHLTVTDANGCSAISTYNVQLGSNVCGYLSGHVVRDTSENCVADSGESGLGGWLVRAEGATDTIYGVSNSEGKYFIGVPLGDYVVTAIKPNNLWELCPPGSLVNVNIAGDTFPGGDIPVKKLFDCPALSVSIGTSLLRRCFSNNYYYLDYCNDGTAVAEDAYILVTLDPFLAPLASSLSFTNLGNNVLRFDIGDVESGECGAFFLQVQVSCDAVLGQTHCTEAHIYPDSTCLPNNPQWTGASLHVSSQCDGDSVRFTIKNIGTGDMSGTVDYVIIEDHVMLMGAPLSPLAASGSTTLAFPANGSTWRLEVDQAPFHPGNSQPSLSVEGCSASAAFSTGFVTQFPNDDADPWLDIDCRQNIGAYDPNDKQGFPVGYGASHYIRPGTEIEYLIRFQNTGTDTAFTVRVVDTLSAWLDPATVRPGASSHEYKFDLTGPGIVEFLFENILLPDSNVNESASNGFVKFSILPRTYAPLETVIENEAAIYFDFNDPVVTNTVFHRLGENFIVATWQPFVPGAEVKVSPNPFGDEAILEVKGLRSSAPLRLRVFDLQGIVVGEMETPNAIFNLRKNTWPAGVYLFSVFQEGKIVGSGKLMVK